MVGFYPILWLDMLVGVTAISWAVYLMYLGIPIVMNIPAERGFLYSSAVLAIALVSAAFRGIEPVMFASLISTAIGFLCKKIRWFFTFLYSTLIGLDATYYILEGSSLVEFVPMRIAGPLRLFLITLFALGFIVKVAGISSKRDNS